MSTSAGSRSPRVTTRTLSFGPATSRPITTGVPGSRWASSNSRIAPTCQVRVFDAGLYTAIAMSAAAAALIRAGEVSDLVAERAARAWEAGADGVIASPNEAAMIRALPEADGRLIVTPGVRPTGAAAGDQKRIATPGAAIRDGADHIVVGRPVWQSDDPRAAAQAILAELP